MEQCASALPQFPSTRRLTSSLPMIMYSITAPALAATLLSFLLLFIHASKSYKGSAKIPTRRSLWYIGSPGFFIRPCYFILETLEWARDSAAAFSVKGNLIILVRGLAGRDAFFSKGLDFMSGYKLLNPQLEDITPTKDIGVGATWAGAIGHLVRSEILDKTLPTLAEDVSRIMDTWGEHGQVNPFDDIYELVFAMSCRLTTCNEFCEDPKKMKKLMNIFSKLEHGSTPSSLLFPYFPTPARINRLIAGAQLYKMCNDVVEARRRENRREDDPIQVMMDKNTSMVEITRFMAMALFGAVTNAGNVIGWIMIYLEANPAWKTRIQIEINSFLKHNRRDPSQTVASILSEVALEQIEQETPELELAINETLRMIFIGTFMRRNLGDDMLVNGTKVKHGAFLMFPTHDLHYNPVLFPQPCKFSPLRFTPEAVEERDESFGINFLGWGAGRHLCPGKRAALVMIRVIMISIFAKFEVADIVDKKGSRIHSVPEAHYSMLFKVCPPAEENRVYLRYQAKPPSMSS